MATADRLRSADSTSHPRDAIPTPAAPAEELSARLPSGTSAGIRHVGALIRQVAGHDSTVLVLGESGTGKEVAARAIHDLSPRRSRPFVALNCGAIPAELLESELFGHEKGSFTGAIAARKGRFEIAEGGTLFLDEIGDMSPAMQVKLLRVLQERVFERVGNHTPIRCNVRIIAATHRNLEEAITRGAFREDLYHRINVFPIEMPALRSRLEDLPQLVEEFSAHNTAEGRPRVTLAPDTLALLARHAWTGNVRELSNLIERLSILCGARIVQPADLPARYRPAGTAELVPSAPQAADAAPAAAVLLTDTEVLRILESPNGAPAATSTSAPVVPEAADLAALPEAGLDLRLHLAGIERALIEQALERTQGTVAHAARLLNLRRTTLVERMRKLGLLSVAPEATEL
ncbi:MAG: sigma-54-dependent Fis family transcriptional regulator [Proteobacteria bacterium]|nr:sigma-54-dependent Fis family transcriptional regulator [Pseudomonadota bacterium]